MKTPRARILLAGPLASILVAAVLTGCGEQTDSSRAASDSDTAGCSSNVGTIVEPTGFVPLDQQRGGSKTPFPLRASTVSANVLATPPFHTSVDGLAARGSFTENGGDAVLYDNNSGPLPSTVPAFLDAGGLILQRWPIQGGTSLASAMRTTVPDRIVNVQVGSYSAVLNWEDPKPGAKNRAHNVTWVEGGANVVLTGVRSPEAIVAAARSLVC